jgi:peptidoglycan/xylan/chitin deacetylase (PgdA/CDA1 family)
MIPIFMYHQVAEIPRQFDPLGLALPPGQFEQQMSYLARHGYHCLTLAEAVQLMRASRRAPANSFVLTFDDGYQDLHSVVCPMLARFGFSATVFLVAGRMGRASDWTGQDGERSGQLLSWAEARELARRGMILGSHTVNHCRLSQLDDRAAHEEIWNSRVVLEDELDMQVEFFSYPYSDTNARVEQSVKAAGYAAACAGNMGPWGQFHLWRTPCGRDDTAFSFALKAGGWYDRRTFLRESAPGRLLRRSVRILKRRPVDRDSGRSDPSHDNLSTKTQGQP